tara:strand:+ start:8278 stop:8475 length:198 start_codon:yes stop_codon:yes gene_type:complete
MNDFVTNDGFEICISCDKPTKVKRDAPVKSRKYYIEGAGQMCKSCYDAIIEKLKIMHQNLNNEEI